MYSFTVTPVVESGAPIAYLAEIMRVNMHGTCCARAWTGSYEEAAGWAINTIDNYNLNEDELKEDMTALMAETRITTGNMS